MTVMQGGRGCGRGLCMRQVCPLLLWGLGWLCLLLALLGWILHLMLQRLPRLMMLCGLPGLGIRLMLQRLLRLMLMGQLHLMLKGLFLAGAGAQRALCSIEQQTHRRDESVAIAQRMHHCVLARQGFGHLTHTLCQDRPRLQAQPCEYKHTQSMTHTRTCLRKQSSKQVSTQTRAAAHMHMLVNPRGPLDAHMRVRARTHTHTHKNVC